MISPDKIKFDEETIVMMEAWYNKIKKALKEELCKLNNPQDVHIGLCKVSLFKSEINLADFLCDFNTNDANNIDTNIDTNIETEVRITELMTSIKATTPKQKELARYLLGE